MYKIDTHVHIDFYEDPLRVILSYKNLDIRAIFVTHLPEIFDKHINTYNLGEQIRLAVGYHPQVVGAYDLDIELFESCLTETKYVGEIGLDRYRGSPDFKNQLNSFEQITQLIGNKKVCSIHSRGAEKQVLDTLIKNDVKFSILHWYSGSLYQLNRAIEFGCYFSVNSSMLASQNGQKILRAIPHERLLIESDGPFTKVNGQKVTPLNYHKVYDAIGEYLNVKNIEGLVFQNFGHLIRGHQATNE